MIWINTAGLGLITLIIWWFWVKKPQPQKATSNVINIEVDNGVYSPGNIEVKLGQPVKLIFLRKDPSPCAEKVIIDKLGVSLDLPVNKPIEFTFKPEQTGDYEFTCQMKMYVGHLNVNS